MKIYNLLWLIALTTNLIAQQKLDVQGDGFLSGKLGIGINNPSAPLHVLTNPSVGPEANGIYVYNPNQTLGAIISTRVGASNVTGDPFISWDIAGSGGWSMGIDNDDSDNLKIINTWRLDESNDNNTALTISRLTRNVGIGTSSPDSKLEVAGGNIRVTGGSFIDDGTTLNVPDYVFSPGYDRKPLYYIESFIRLNSHLHGIPSESDINSWAALSLQDRDMKLLEKIEELFLHTIDQQHSIDSYKKKCNKQEEIIVRLENRINKLEYLVDHLINSVEKPSKTNSQE